MPTEIHSERHFTVPEIAQLWHTSDDTIRKHFRDVPGVIKLGHLDRPRKRRYCRLLIPESILRKVHASLHGQVPR